MRNKGGAIVEGDTNQLRELVERFEATRLGILGDFMLDEYVWGNVSRISPEAPVPIVEAGEESFALGGAGNVLMNIRVLDGTPVPFGVVGEDEAGEKIEGILEKNAPDGHPYLLRDATRPTTVKTRIVAHNQHVVRVDRESRSPIEEALQGRILAGLRSEIRQLGGLIVSDYNKGVVSRKLFDQVIRICCEVDVPVFLDPKAFDLKNVGPVMAICPNQHEAERFSGIPISSPESCDRAGQALLHYTGAKHILITQGERGMALFSATEPPVHMPAQARQVFDVTGAGDTVMSILALAVAGGASAAQAARLANLGAGIVVGKVGTATVSRNELTAALDGNCPAVGEGRPRKPWAQRV